MVAVVVVVVVVSVVEEGNAEDDDDDDGPDAGSDEKEEKYIGVFPDPIMKALPPGGSQEQAPLSCSVSQHIQPVLAPQSVRPVMPVRLASRRLVISSSRERE